MKHLIKSIFHCKTVDYEFFIIKIGWNSSLLWDEFPKLTIVNKKN